METVFSAFDRAYDALGATHDAIVEHECAAGTYNDAAGIVAALDALRATHVQMIIRNPEAYAAYLISQHAARESSVMGTLAGGRLTLTPRGRRTVGG